MILSIQEIIRTNSLAFSAISLGFIILLLVFAYLKEVTAGEKFKIISFSLISFIVILNTAYLVGGTIYINHKSVSDGPVHWHADFEIWNCGKEINLKDPTNFSNNIGEPIVHEHNDKRLHIEGAILEQKEASLGYFFQIIGGKFENNKLVVPINEGFLTMKTGDTCSDGQTAVIQAFLYKTTDGVYRQQKMINPSNYLISPHSYVPPGDCIIIELDVLKEKTDRLCEQYKVAEEVGKIRGN